eukprot:TRINITY_DN8329_c0_g1_i2.p1 TRINITY_DN8329_c0_g1~~TRINITY_DN8329_c0_g1_i2.p1  ORF type:complete len:338 (+),score=86.12 TRINITY_DN8329_c0_g1_i2:50-1015(+)
MDIPWSVTNEASRAWIRACFGRGGGLKELEDLLSPGWCSNPETAVDSRGRTAAHVLADYGWDEGMKTLYETAADTRKGELAGVKDHSGNTPLHLAIQSKMTAETIQLLCDARSIPDIHGNTPLHMAVATRHLPALTVLLDAQTSPFTVNLQGATAYDLALAFSETQLEADLLAAFIRSHCSAYCTVIVVAIVCVYGVQLKHRKVNFQATPSALTARAYSLLSKETFRKSFSTDPPPGSRSSAILGEYGRRRGMTSFSMEAEERTEANRKKTKPSKKGRIDEEEEEEEEEELEDEKEEEEDALVSSAQSESEEEELVSRSDC